MLLPLAVFCCAPQIQIRNQQNNLFIDNGKIQLTLDKKVGCFDVSWGHSASIDGAVVEARIGETGVHKASEYAEHSIAPEDVHRVRDGFGSGYQVTWRHHKADLPDLVQMFWIYADRPEVIERVEVRSKSEISSNYLAPFASIASLAFPNGSPLQALFVPWDNDNYFRFRSDGWGEGEGDGDGSYEVGAVYDDISRHGLIVGSIDHDLWKSAIRFKRDTNGRLADLHAFAGVTSKYTHDRQGHGSISGTLLASPRYVIGWYSDWRSGLERYGDLNAIVKPPLPSLKSPPFGWNSWSAHKMSVNAADARAATDLIHDHLPYLRSNGTATINFDAGNGNLTRDQMKAFIQHAHLLGLKAGTYWTPFACWGELDQIRDDAPRTFREIVLKDDKGVPLPKLDGSYPFDLSHPTVLSRIDHQLKEIVDMGFDYIKMDFMSHGALEGKHFDPKIETGIAAYNLGMQRIVDDLSPKRIGRKVFISLSIAPLFPHGYADSRRISCDVFANIGASEYLLNSTNYGWWPAKRLYRFDDADSVCVYQANGEPPVTEAEARTRFTASAISGGMMIQSDDLTSPVAKDRVSKLFSNREILDLARCAPEFWPVDGTTGTRAGDLFVWHDGSRTYVAAFNFDKTASKSMSVTVDRLGLRSQPFKVHNLWTGSSSSFEGALKLTIPPMDCQLICLEKS